MTYVCTACRARLLRPQIRTVRVRQHQQWHIATHWDCPECQEKDAVGILEEGDEPHATNHDNHSAVLG
jgi:RNase P subunit RPR2